MLQSTECRVVLSTLRLFIKYKRRFSSNTFLEEVVCEVKGVACQVEVVRSDIQGVRYVWNIMF